MRWLTRRTTIAAVASTVTLGCLSGSGQQSPESESHDDDEGDADDEGTPMDDDAHDLSDDDAHDLYIENHSDTTHCVRAVVSTEDEALVDDEPLVDDEYAIAPDEGVVFRELLTEATYTIAGTVETIGEVEETWTRTTCPADANNQDAGILVENDRVWVYRNQCDTVDIGTTLEYTSSEARRGCDELE